MPYGYESDVECPRCGWEGVRRDWVDGECPVCGNTYTTVEDCTEALSDCWTYANWQYYGGAHKMPIREEIAEAFVHYLNSLAQIDNKALAELIAHGVPCNQALHDHPTVQVRDHGKGASCATVGFLGILNGFFGTYDESPCKGYGPIAVVTNARTTTITRFGLTRDIFPDDMP